MYKTPLPVDQIAANIKARASFETLLEFLPELTIDGMYEQRFWLLLAEHAADKCGKRLADPEDKSLPMTLEEATAFEHEVMPYGYYKGQEIHRVADSYWAGVYEGDFAKKVGRYLHSQRYQMRHEEE